eukprot:INCI4964.11.p1 GENE.INCI4964.11~~INCI4964.11.p1  ORF type:complete len:2408 (+),score=294.54 INCI4964.11:1047-7226(+)
MANIYMLQTYGSQIVAEIVSSTKLRHALNKLASVLVFSVLSIFVHAAFTVYAIVNRDPTFGPLANQPNFWLVATSWIPNLLPIALLIAWAWKVESAQQSSTHKQLDVDSIWNHQLRHLLQESQDEAGAQYVGHPMVNVSSDDHVGAVSFQAIAVRDSNDELGRGRGRGSSSSDAVGITPYGSFDADLLSALSIPASPDGLLAARVRAAEQLAREGSIMPECVRLSSSAPDARGLMGMLSRAGDKRYSGLGLAAAAKYLGRVSVQGKKTAAMLRKSTYVANWAALLGPTIEDFVPVQSMTNPSKSATRDDGTLWVSVSCGNLTRAALKQLFWEESMPTFGNVASAHLACTLIPPRAEEFAAPQGDKEINSQSNVPGKASSRASQKRKSLQEPLVASTGGTSAPSNRFSIGRDSTRNRSGVSSDWEFAGMTEVLPQRHRLDFRVCIPLHVSFDPLFSGTSHWGLAPSSSAAGRAQAAAAAALKRRSAARGANKGDASLQNTLKRNNTGAGPNSATNATNSASDNDTARARHSDIAELLRHGYRCQWRVRIDLHSASSPGVYHRKDLLHQQTLYSFECTVSELLKHQGARRKVPGSSGWIKVAVEAGMDSFPDDPRVERRVYALRHQCIGDAVNDEPAGLRTVRHAPGDTRVKAVVEATSESSQDNNAWPRAIKSRSHENPEFQCEPRLNEPHSTGPGDVGGEGHGTMQDASVSHQSGGDKDQASSRDPGSTTIAPESGNYSVPHGQLIKTVVEESLFESVFSLVVPLKMLPFVIRKRQDLLKQAQQDHQQFYESITGTIMLRDGGSRASDGQADMHRITQPQMAKGLRQVNNKSVSRPDASPVVSSRGSGSSGRTHQVSHLREVGGGAVSLAPGQSAEGDSYDSIVGALRTAADYEVRLAFLARRVKHRRRAVEEAEDALEKIRLRMQRNLLFRSSQTKKKKGAVQFIGTNLHLQRLCMWQFHRPDTGSAQDPKKVMQPSHTPMQPSSKTGLISGATESRMSATAGAQASPHHFPSTPISGQLQVGSPTDIAVPSPSPWKVLLFQRSESEPHFAHGSHKNELNSGRGSSPLPPTQKRSASVPHITSSTSPAASACAASGVPASKTPGLREVICENRVHGSSEWSPPIGISSKYRDSSSSTTSATFSHYGRTPRSSHGRSHAVSNASYASTRTDGSSTSRGTDYGSKNSNNIDIVSWITHYLKRRRRSHGGSSRASRAPAIPPVAASSRLRAAAAVFDTVTVGCPAAHALGFKRGGIRQLVDTQLKLRRKILAHDISLFSNASTPHAIRVPQSHRGGSPRMHSTGMGHSRDKSAGSWRALNSSQDSVRSGASRAGFNSSSDSVLTDDFGSGDVRHGGSFVGATPSSALSAFSYPSPKNTPGSGGSAHRVGNRPSAKSAANSHALVTKELEELDSVTWELAQRVDVVLSQAASALITAFCANLEVALNAKRNTSAHRQRRPPSETEGASVTNVGDDASGHPEVGNLSHRFANLARPDGSIRTIADMVASLAAAKASKATVPGMDAPGPPVHSTPNKPQPSTPYLQNLFDSGYILFWESLLSTRGKEIGMLGDLDYAVKHLSDFHFRIVPVQHRSGMPSEAQHAELNSSLDTDLPSNDNSHVDGSHEHLRARIVATRIRQLDQSKLQSRPGDTAAESSRGRGQSVGSGGRRRRKRSRKTSPGLNANAGKHERPVWLVDIMVAGMNSTDAAFVQAQNQYVQTFAVLFTQGINEMQTFANRLGQAGLQDSINQESLQRLWRFCERFRKAKSRSQHEPEPQDADAPPLGPRVDENSTSQAAGAARWHDVQTRLEALEENLFSHRGRSQKNTELLQQAASLARFLDAGRVTICKSAKDRTSMSVTLEQSRLVRDHIDTSCRHCVSALTHSPGAAGIPRRSDAPESADRESGRTSANGNVEVQATHANAQVGGVRSTPRSSSPEKDLHETNALDVADAEVLGQHHAHVSRMQRSRQLQEELAALMRTNGVRRENAYVCGSMCFARRERSKWFSLNISVSLTLPLQEKEHWKTGFCFQRPPAQYASKSVPTSSAHWGRKVFLVCPELSTY